jgi:selenide,water dikinase
MATHPSVRLTELSHGAGCGCKIAPDRLAEVLAAFPPETDPDLLVGSEHSDDAAVYRIGPGQAIVHTADFFTPIVDDPYDFGRIAATNALSDIYAMGARPLVAINLVALSLDDLGGEILGEILRGGRDAVHGAGAVIGGGHSIEDAEPKYGLGVCGIVDPERMLTNAGGRAGDALVLTKPLGAGLIATAVKRGIAGAETIARAVEVMTTLNADAAAAAVAAGASAATDVTGFGLVGHAHELALASGLTAEIDAAAVPAIEGVIELAEGGEATAGGTRRNARHAAAFTTFAEDVPEARRILCADAMTSGGLLVAIDPGRAGEIPGPVIGGLREGGAGEIRVS